MLFVRPLVQGPEVLDKRVPGQERHSQIGVNLPSGYL